MTSMLYGYYITDMETGYKAFERKVLINIELNSKSFDFEPEVTSKILKRGILIHEVDIQTKPRSYEEGKKINAFSDGLKALYNLFKYRFFE